MKSFIFGLDTLPQLFKENIIQYYLTFPEIYDPGNRVEIDFDKIIEFDLMFWYMVLIESVSNFYLVKILDGIPQFYLVKILDEFNIYLVKLIDGFNIYLVKLVDGFDIYLMKILEGIPQFHMVKLFEFNWDYDMLYERFEDISRFP